MVKVKNPYFSYQSIAESFTPHLIVGQEILVCENFFYFEKIIKLHWPFSGVLEEENNIEVIIASHCRLQSV